MADTRPTLNQQDIEAIRQGVELGLLDTSRTLNRRFVLTGSMSMKRDHMKQIIRAVGGVVEDGIRWNTDFLIVGDTGIHGRTNKIREAEARDITVMTETEFTDMIKP